MKRFIALISSVILFCAYSNCSAAQFDADDNFTIQMQINNPVITVNGIAQYYHRKITKKHICLKSPNPLKRQIVQN